LLCTIMSCICDSPLVRKSKLNMLSLGNTPPLLALLFSACLCDPPQELERFKAAQFEDNKQLLREQQAIVHALQMQFEEYRRSAEQIFRIESGKLEDKLQVYQWGLRSLLLFHFIYTHYSSLQSIHFD
jgi:hypothetical protein